MQQEFGAQNRNDRWQLRFLCLCTVLLSPRPPVVVETHSSGTGVAVSQTPIKQMVCVFTVLSNRNFKDSSPMADGLFTGQYTG
jgi:hypothetical protein